MQFLLENKTFLYIFLCFFTFLLAFLLSLIFVFLIKKYAVSLKLVDPPGERKIHKKTMPVGGGIAIVLAIMSSLIFIFVICKSSFFPFGNRTIFSIIPTQMLCILLCSIFIFFVGLIDDYINLKAMTKLYAQILIAFILCLFDVRLTIFIDNYFFSFIVTILWIVLITNAFNLLDNMDGLSAGVAFIIGGILIWVMVSLGQWLIVFVLCSLLGALLGFLKYNFYPASIFMGDSGSLFIGFLLASLTIYADFYQMNLPYYSVVLPLLAFAIPIFDTGTVVMFRWREGRPIFKGDTNHFSHRLTKLGLEPKQAVIVIYLITFATAINTTLLYQVDDWVGATVIIIQLIAILLIIHLLERVSYASQSK